MVVDTHPSTHPPLPPTTEDERLSWLRLLRCRRVGPATFYRLLAEHGSATRALEALPAVAAEAGLRDYAPCPETVAKQELARGQACGARLLLRGDPDYPVPFQDLAEPPPVLWVLGRAELLSRPAIAVVGTRRPSSLALRMARRLARDLGQAGHVVVSGLARGVDTAAHEAALDSGTIAVMAGGVDQVYPLENKELGDRIAQAGLRLSDQPPGLEPAPRHFAMRNRLISGLARAVVVVEAATKSGTLITARHALDQGREVLSVPGHPLDPRAAGCNLLLRDGAVLVRHAGDVLEAIGAADAPTADPARAPADPAPPPVSTAPPPPPRRSLREMARLHQRILDRLGDAPATEDALIRDMKAAPNQVSPVLTDLEIEGRIERGPGGLISRAP